MIVWFRSARDYLWAGNVGAGILGGGKVIFDYQKRMAGN